MLTSCQGLQTSSTICTWATWHTISRIYIHVRHESRTPLGRQRSWPCLELLRHRPPTIYFLQSRKWPRSSITLPWQGYHCIMLREYTFSLATRSSTVAHSVRDEREHSIKADRVYSHNDMKELRCMSFTGRGTSEILVAGLQNQMFTIDVERGTVTKQVWRTWYTHGSC
jgi:hypothetical protein